MICWILCPANLEYQEQLGHHIESNHTRLQPMSATDRATHIGMYDRKLLDAIQNDLLIEEIFILEISKSKTNRWNFIVSILYHWVRQGNTFFRISSLRCRCMISFRSHLSHFVARYAVPSNAYTLFRKFQHKHRELFCHWSMSILLFRTALGRCKRLFQYYLWNLYYKWSAFWMWILLIRINVILNISVFFSYFVGMKNNNTIMD